MNIQCPMCKRIVEVQMELEDGQHIECPHCKVKFAYGYKGSTVIRPDVPKKAKSVGRDGGEKGRFPLWAKVVSCVVGGIMVLKIVENIIFPSGHGWRVEFGDSDDGNAEARVFVDLSVIAQNSPYQFLTSRGGYAVAVDKDNHEAHILFPEEGKDGKWDGIHYESCGRAFKYQLGIDSQWQEFKKVIYEMTKGKTAKEVVNYVGKYK